MSEEQIVLARRAVACKGWRWMPGMAFLDGGESWRVASARHAETIHADRLPDLTDAATLGCLLALVREVCGPLACTYIRSDVPSCWIVRTVHYEYYDGTRAEDHGYSEHSEAEALVAALEAAP